ncbi:hypothetical protein B0H19DRAFT_1297564 [Mycena capillaripes]|nr:hypothetical protein B0H19DRAFT_1297564 [Mycena capillaripes]
MAAATGVAGTYTPRPTANPRFRAVGRLRYHGISRDAPSVQFKPPNTAGSAQNVSQGFIGFGIEMSSFTDFGGRAKPNNLSNNLMSAISTRTGAPVHIRVGGTSMDNTIFNASNPSVITHTGNQSACRLHTNATVGAPWLSAFKNFNVGTRFTVQVLPITVPALLKARGAGGAGFAILGIFDLNLPWGQNCWNTRAVQFGSGLPPPLPVRSRTWNSLNRTANLEVHFHPVSALSTCFGTRPALVFSACFRPWNSLSGTANPFAHLYRISGSALGPAAGSKRVQCVFWHLLRSSVSSRASAPAIPLAAPLIPSHTPIASPLRLWAPQPAPRTCSARLALDPPPFSRALPPARFLHRYH